VIFSDSTIPCNAILITLAPHAEIVLVVVTVDPGHQVWVSLGESHHLRIVPHVMGVGRVHRGVGDMITFMPLVAASTQAAFSLPIRQDPMVLFYICA
jgi:hypothetical protein